MGNTVYCSISTDDNNGEEIFPLVAGKNGNNFDLEKILPLPAIFGKIKAAGFRDVLALVHIDQTFKENKQEASEKILKTVSRKAYDFKSGHIPDVEKAIDDLLNIYINQITLRYDENGNLRTTEPLFTPEYYDQAYFFPATLDEVLADAAVIYQTFEETGHIWESEWRYENLGIGYQPRFGDTEEDFIKFEANNAAPIQAFILFAQKVKLNGDAEYFEENEDFWGKLNFKNGELVEHRASLPEDKEDFFTEDEDEDE